MPTELPAPPEPLAPASDRPDRLVLVVGTGTEVGKTWVAAALLQRLRAAGHPVAARKPVQSFEVGDPPESTDAGILGRATGEPHETVCPPDRWYPVAMAPPMAAEALGRPPFTIADLASEVRWPTVWPAGPQPSIGLVESAGGVRSPQASDGDAVELARLLSPDVVVLVADAGLGTINGVRLSVDALGLGTVAPGTVAPGTVAPGTVAPGTPLVVVLNRFDPAQDLHRRNRAWLSGRDGLVVLVTPGEEDALCRSIVAPYSVGQEAMPVNRVDEGDEQRSDEPHWGEAVTTASATPRPGDIAISPGLGVATGPLVGSEESTPLEEDEPEGTIPPSPLWAMKGRRHIQWHLLPSHERHERVRDCLGTGDDAIYVIDDGKHHAMLGRRVGARVGEVEYCLIGRVPRDRYEALRDGSVSPAGAFYGATGIILCGVVEEEAVLSSIIFDVAQYEDAGEIPAEYLPGAPYIEFAQDLEITAD